MENNFSWELREFVSDNCMQSQNKFIFGKLNQLKQLYVYSKNITQIFNTTKVTFHCFGKNKIRNSILILQSKTFTVSEKTKTRNSILTKQTVFTTFGIYHIQVFNYLNNQQFNT
jgi:hypothetical protein